MLRRPTPSSKTHDTSRLLTRRNLLLILGAGLTLFNLPRWLQDPTPQNIATSASEINPPISSEQQNEFLKLSALLTAHQPLSSQTSARTYLALSDQSPQFRQQAGALFQFVQTHQISDVDTLFNALRAIKNQTEQARLISVMHQIISAWYLGIVGEGANSKTIAFESALMFDQVHDVVAVPGYCPAAPGYWATQPST